MAGTPLKNLRMFEELCGKNAFKNIILTTTMWDEVDKEMGEDREAQLKKEYWRTMLERNSTTSRFLRTRESAFELIEPLIDAANIRSSVLLQNELVDMRKSLPATSAGLELFSAMGQLVSQREDLLRRIRKEMSRSDGDKMTLEPLQEEHQNLQKSLETMVFEMRRLRLPLGKRFLIMTDKFFSSKFEILKSFILKKRISKNPIGRTTGNQSPPTEQAQIVTVSQPPPTTEQAHANVVTVSQPPPQATTEQARANIVTVSQPPTTEQAQANVITASQSPSTTVTASSGQCSTRSRHAVPVSSAYLNHDRELPVMPTVRESGSTVP